MERKHQLQRLFACTDNAFALPNKCTLPQVESGNSSFKPTKRLAKQRRLCSCYAPFRTAAATHPLELEVSRRPNLQGVSCQPRIVYGLTFPTLCLNPERWMGLRKPSIHKMQHSHLTNNVLILKYRMWQLHLIGEEWMICHFSLIQVHFVFC